MSTMRFFPKKCAAEKKNCSLCSIYIRIGLLCLAVLWLWGNTELLWALIQHTSAPSNAATQAAILADILLPVIIVVSILRKILRKKKTVK